MFGMIGGLASAGLGFAGAMRNAEAQEDANQMNWAVNVMNYQQRERERAEAIAMANKLRNEQKLGTTDIRGTRTQFVPGKGWVTTGAPELLEMMKLQDAEQRKVLTQDLPMRRSVMQRNYTRGLEEEALADTFRRQLKNTVPAGSDDAYASDLYTAMASGLREASQDAGRRVFTQGMRTGQNSNFADIAGQLQRADNTAYSNAALQAKLMSRGMADKEVADRQNRLANLYNLFATRAQQLPEVNYKPQALDAAGSSESSAKGALAAGELATKMAAMKGGELDYIAPNMGYGNALSGLGSGLGSAFGAMGAQQRYQQQGNPSQAQVSGFGSTSGGGGSNSYYLDNEFGGIGGW